jgi:hypothetical protein
MPENDSSDAAAATWHPDPGTYFPIISLCGGGFRGLLSAKLLANLVDGLRSVCAAYPQLIEQTAMLAGTSTGADIAGMLLCRNGNYNHGAIGMQPIQIVDYFRGLGSFQGPDGEPGGETHFFLHPEGGQYPPRRHDAPNYSVDEVAYGAAKLHRTQAGVVPVLGQFPRNLVLTSFQVGSPAQVQPATGPTPWGPLLFHNVDLPWGTPFAPTPETSIVEAVVSSSAIPGMIGAYYPGYTGTDKSAQAPGVMGQIDGAFFAHDPTLAAIAVAVAAGVPLEQIVVLSIGAGRTQSYLPDTRGWGAYDWMGTTPPRTGTGNLAPFLLGGGVSPMVSLALNGTSAMLTPNLAKLLLGDRFLCLSPVLDPFPTEAQVDEATQKQLLDAADQEPLLRKAASFVNHYWAKTSGPAPISAVALPA